LKAHRLLLFLTLLNLLNFVDRQLIASFANFIIPELELTNAQFGFLTSLAFIVFYSVMGLFMGTLADNLNRPKLIAFGVVLWSVFTALTGAAKGFASMALPRLFIGVGESILTPTSMSLLSDTYPSKRLGFAAGFYYMGIPLGVGASLLIVGYLGDSLGWRNCFYLLGAIGLILGLCTLFFKERPRVHIQEGNNKAVKKIELKSSIKTLVLALKSSPALVFTILGGVFYHIILGAAVFEQPWFVEERSFDRSEIAKITGYISICIGVLGSLVGGLAGDWWQENTKQGRPMFLFWLSIVFLPIGIIYRVVEPGTAFFWFAVGVGYFQLGCFYGPTFSTVQELVPLKIRATVVAFYILTLNLIGLTLGSIGSGQLVDYFMSINYPDPYTWTLIIFSVIGSLCIPCYYMAGKKFHQDKNNLEEIFKSDQTV
jgi:MFS family permease